MYLHISVFTTALHYRYFFVIIFETLALHFDKYIMHKRNNRSLSKADSESDQATLQNIWNFDHQQSKFVLVPLYAFIRMIKSSLYMLQVTHQKPLLLIMCPYYHLLFLFELNQILANYNNEVGLLYQRHYCNVISLDHEMRRRVEYVYRIHLAKWACEPHNLIPLRLFPHRRF